MAGAYKYNGNVSYELINGEFRMMSRPSVNHMTIEGNILATFKNYLKGKSCRPFNETDVFLDDMNNFVPDVMIVCDPEIIEEDGIHGAPDLVVDILSKSTKKLDRDDKFYKYEQHGIKEYWIVDPFMKCVEVYHLIEGKFVKTCDAQLYTEREYSRLNDKEKAEVISEIKVSLYDDFVVKVEDVFEYVK